MYIEIPDSEKDFTFDYLWIPKENAERATVSLWDVPIYSKDYPSDMGVGQMEDDIRSIIANKLAKLLED